MLGGVGWCWVVLGDAGEVVVVLVGYWVMLGGAVGGLGRVSGGVGGIGGAGRCMLECCGGRWRVVLRDAGRKYTQRNTYPNNL